MPGGVAALALSAERIALPPTMRATAVQPDVLLSAIEIDTGDPRATAKHLAKNPSRLCPVVEERRGGVRLRCTTRRFDAQLVTSGGRTFIDLHELRGLPTRPSENGAPQVTYTPSEYGLGGPCPGTTPAGRGECALADGRLAEAAAHLREAFGSEPTFAALRLGDIALATGDPNLAIAWYRRAPRQGVFGRLAIARECEITGSCFERLATAFEPAGLPEPARTELELRGIRARLILGRTEEAATLLTRRLLEANRPAACALAPALCRRVTLAALRDPGPAGPGPAIALYLALPTRDRAPLADVLAREVAEAAAGMGAPAFAANILASIVHEARAADLPDALARIAELYLAAEDRSRARIIADHARTRLTLAQLSSARWKAIRAAIERKNPAEARTPSLPASPTTGLAQAAQALARTRSMRAMEER